MERALVVVISLVLGYAAIAAVIVLVAVIIERIRHPVPHPCGDPDCTENHGERER